MKAFLQKLKSSRLKKLLPGMLAILAIAAACYFIPPLFPADTPGTAHGISSASPSPAGSPSPVSSPAASQAPQADPSEMRTLRITGAVNYPGEYTLPANYDLIQFVNLAQPKIDADTSDKALMKPPPDDMTEYELASYRR